MVKNDGTHQSTRTNQDGNHQTFVKQEAVDRHVSISRTVIRSPSPQFGFEPLFVEGNNLASFDTGELDLASLDHRLTSLPCSRDCSPMRETSLSSPQASGNESTTAVISCATSPISSGIPARLESYTSDNGAPGRAVEPREGYQSVNRQQQYNHDANMQNHPHNSSLTMCSINPTSHGRAGCVPVFHVQTGMPIDDASLQAQMTALQAFSMIEVNPAPVSWDPSPDLVLAQVVQPALANVSWHTSNDHQPHCLVPGSERRFDYMSEQIQDNMTRKRSRAVAEGEHVVEQLQHEGLMYEADKLQPGIRRRVRVACVNCHKAKVMCDSGRPCKRCIRLGIADLCVDRVHRRMGRPPKAKPCAKEAHSKERLDHPLKRRCGKVQNTLEHVPEDESTLDEIPHST